MVAKFLKYKGPVINDVTDTGTTYTVYSPGQLYLSKNLVDLGDGFYRDKTLPYENAVSKKYFKPYYPYLYHIAIGIVVLSIVLYIKYR